MKIFFGNLFAHFVDPHNSREDLENAKLSGCRDGSKAA